MTNTFSKSRFIGAVALFAGTGIGAGMLGLPVKTAELGFIPSSFLFILVWLMMLGTGWIYVTLFIRYPQYSNLLSLTGFLLGSGGRYLIWMLYLALFYSLLVAYTSAFGEILPAITLNMLTRHQAILLSTTLLSIALILGTRIVDHVNRFLMAGLIATFSGFIFFGFSSIQSENLLASSPNGISLQTFLPAVPLLITTFGYHGIIPTVVTYLDGNRTYLRRALLLGTFTSLLVYLLWQGFIMGIVPYDAPHGLSWAKEQGSTALLALEAQTGFGWTELLGFWFAFFAVTTSYFGVALGLCDFLVDGMRLSSSKKTRTPLVLILVATPTIFAWFDPTLFLKALSYGGMIGSILFIGVPLLLLYKSRQLKA